MSDSRPQTPEQSLSDELRELIHKRNMLTERTKTRVIYELQKEKIENEERRLYFQRETLKEIITSEERYINQLDIILKYFRTPLEHVIDQTSAAGLFKNIEILYNLNCELLQKLKMNSRPENIADAFMKVAPFLKLYTTYTNEYKRVIFTIQELRRQDQRLNDNLMRQETRPEVGMRLNSLLIVPIQRVPRYILLLKELLEHSSPDKVEFKKVEDALQQVEEVTNYINNQVNQQDNLLRLMQIQLNLFGGKPNIIIPGRKLIKEGVLMKVSQKGNKSKPRHFVLMTDALMCCKMKSGSLNCTCLLPLRKCSVEHVLGRGVFNVTAPGHSILLHSENNQAADEWVEAIKMAKSQYEDRRRTLQKKISSRQALRINQCLTLDDSSVTYETVNRKRKRVEETDQKNCFPSIKKRLISANGKNKNILVEIKHDSQNNIKDCYFGSVTRLLMKVKSYWF
ncbi:rho guanine nucleotide exchange factor 4 [Lycorma delicatula]|uniref:rho guanine nucleotide exchange factor 4 n=1 Tax=Lycorma delicatula TaxID=130591 RepID=UPI003F514B81